MHSLRFRIILTVVFGLLAGGFQIATAQIKNIGIPFIKNYRSVDYEYHPRNFSIVQDKRGIFFIGNTHGVMEFDGVNWGKIELPRGLSGVSMALNDQGKVFIGSNEDLGYLEADSIGSTKFKSLMALVPAEHKNFGEIKKIIARGKEVLFLAGPRILVYANGKIKVFHSEEGNFSMVRDSDNFYLSNPNDGLCLYEKNVLRKLDGSEFYKNKKILQVFTINNQILFLTPDGIYQYDGKNSIYWSKFPHWISDSRITVGIQLKDGRMAIGTSKNGIIIIDNNGNITAQFDKSVGILSNSVNDLFEDNNGNLWITSDIGISYIQINNPFTFINGEFGLEGMGYSASILNDKIYLATSQGVYVSNWDPKHSSVFASLQFKLIDGTEGQVHSLNLLNGTLFCGHKTGTFIIEGTKARLISGYSGAWIHRAIGKDIVLAGTYSGVEVYKKVNNDWKYVGLLKGFDESSRLMEIDGDNIWICHGNKGLYRIKADLTNMIVKEVINYSLKLGFPTVFFNDMSRIKNELLFASDKGLYRFDAAKDSMVYSTIFKPASLNETFINKIFELNDSTICVIHYEHVILFRKNKNGGYTADETSMKSVKGKLIESFEFLRALDRDHIFAGVQEGFIHYNVGMPISKASSFQTLIRKVEIIEGRDSIIFGGTFSGSEKSRMFGFNAPQLSFKNNSIRISFAAPFYEGAEANEYQVKIHRRNNASDSLWSPWMSSTYKEYTNLVEGDYAFHVRAKNMYGEISEESVYFFTVLPPWYRTWWAYVLYFVIVIIIVYLIVKGVLKKIKKEKQRVSIEKEKEMRKMQKKYMAEQLKAENEIIHLQNKQLETEVDYKNKELAVLATSLSQKSEFLSQLKKELVSIKENSDTTSITQLIKTIDQGSDFDNSWDQFQINFDKVHKDFLSRLRETYPTLKPADLLICAYVKMSKSNKEIAAAMNISVSAVEKRRYRLREKLMLTDDIRLTEFILGFSS